METANGGLTKTGAATKITGWRRLIDPIGGLRRLTAAAEGSTIDCESLNQIADHSFEKSRQIETLQQRKGPNYRSGHLDCL